MFSKFLTPLYNRTFSADESHSEAAVAESQGADILGSLLSQGITAFEESLFEKAKEMFTAALNISTEGDSFQSEIYFYLAQLTDDLTAKYDYFKKSLLAYTTQLKNIPYAGEEQNTIIELKFQCMIQFAKALLHAKETTQVFNLFRENQDTLTNINKINPQSIAVFNFYLINGAALLLDDKVDGGNKFMHKAKQMLLKGEIEHNIYNDTVVTTLAPLLAKLEPQQIELFTASEINISNSPFDFTNIAAAIGKDKLLARSVKSK